MAIKEAGKFAEQTGVTSATAAADRTIKLRPEKSASFMLDLTSGSPSTGARIEVTNSKPKDIDDGNAVWVVPEGVAYTLVDKMFKSNGANGSQLTGVRLSVSDGTWSLSVRSE